MQHIKIAVIGAGNMGSSIICGLIKKGWDPHLIRAANPSLPKLHNLQKQFGIHISQDNIQCVTLADVIILAIKPKNFAEVAKQISPYVSTQLIISLAAGINLASMQTLLNAAAPPIPPSAPIPIVRAMPNTASTIGAGITGLLANSTVTPVQRNIVEDILSAVGATIWLSDESQMDAVTAISGSGPAYYFLVMQALEDAASELGLPTEIAHQLVTQTALGACRMSIESDKSLAELQNDVTSPGGTTEKALEVLEALDLRGMFRKAVQAAKLRAEEIAKTNAAF